MKMAIKYGVGLNNDGTWYGYVHRGSSRWKSANVATRDEAMKLAQEENEKTYEKSVDNR